MNADQSLTVFLIALVAATITGLLCWGFTTAALVKARVAAEQQQHIMRKSYESIIDALEHELAALHEAEVKRLQAAVDALSPAKPPLKWALCVPRYAIPIEALTIQTFAAVTFREQVLERWEHQLLLLDRADCETDETMLQIIPYVVVCRVPASSGCALSFFTYSRGKGGAEERLHGALSIGLGGHIDDEVPESLTLEEWCQCEAARELQEEIGLTVEASRVRFKNVMLVDPTNAVGRVHLGLLAFVRVTEADVLEKAEAEVVEHGQWLTLEELRLPATYDRLENWSKAAVQFMAQGNKWQSQ